MSPSKIAPPADAMTASQLAAFRARQKLRSIALAIVLVALVVLFFAITLVKLEQESAARSAQLKLGAAARSVATPGAMAH